MISFSAHIDKLLFNRHGNQGTILISFSIFETSNKEKMSFKLRRYKKFRKYVGLKNPGL